jgi:hypothetical protein
MVTIDGKYDMDKIKGKRFSEAELQIIKLVIEKSKVKRERASLLINKGLTLYFCFLIVAVFGFTYKFISTWTLNVLIFAGFGVLIIATIPYLQLMHKSEDEIDMMFDYIFK